MQPYRSILMTLKHASEDMKNNKQEVLASVMEYGINLEFASPALKADIDVVKAAVGQDPKAIRFANPRLQRQLIEEYPEKLRYMVTGLQKEILANDPMKLKYASPSLKENRGLVEGLIEIDGRALKFASYALQKEILKADPSKMQHASTTLQEENMAEDIGRLAFVKSKHRSGVNFVDDALAFRLAASQYGRVVNNNGNLTLQLTAEEAARDILIALLSLPNHELIEDQNKHYENKLNIIYTVLDKPYLVISLAQRMQERLSAMPTSEITPLAAAVEPLPNSSIAKEKYNYPIYPSLISQLSSEEGVLEFIQDHLLVLICKDQMPIRGAADGVRAVFISLIKDNKQLKTEIIKLADGYVSVADYVGTLSDNEFVSLLVNLKPEYLFSLRKSILISNNPDKEMVRDALKQDWQLLSCVIPDLQDDINTVKIAIIQNSRALQYASKRVQKKILEKTPSILCSASYDIQREFISSHLPSLQYASRSIQEEAIAACPINLQYVTKHVRNDRSVVLTAVKKDGQVLQYASKTLRNDKEVVLAAVKQNAMALEYASAILQNDKKIAVIALFACGRALQYVSDDLKQNKRIVLIAVSKDIRVLRYASGSLKMDADLKEDAKVFKAALAKYKDTAMHHSTPTLRLTSKEASQNILIALSSSNQELAEDKLNLVYTVLAKPYMAANLAWCMHMVLASKIERLIRGLDNKTQKPDTISVWDLFNTPISERKFDFPIDVSLLTKLSSEVGLRNLMRERLKDIICKGKKDDLSEFRIKFIDEIKANYNLKYSVAKLLGIPVTILAEGDVEKIDDQDLMDLLVKLEPGDLLSLKSAILSSNNCHKEVVLAAVKKYGASLQYASADLRNNREVVLAAVRQDAMSLKYASPALRNDKRIVLVAISNDVIALKYASDDLKKNKRIVLLAASKNLRALKYAGDDLRMDADFKEDVKIFQAALTQYKDLSANHNAATLWLTKEEASQNIVVELSLLSKQSIKTDKLNIICLALAKPHMVTSLAWCLQVAMAYEGSNLMKQFAKGGMKKSAGLFSIAPVATGKSDFSIDLWLLNQLSSHSGLQEFIQEQLHILICCHTGSLDIFRTQFVDALIGNYNLKLDVVKLLNLQPTFSGLFEPLLLKDKVEKLTDQDLLCLLMKLEPNNFLSLQDKILRLNHEDLEEISIEPLCVLS